jgi:hypothetical protein
MNDWQTWAVIATVILSVLFLVNHARRGKRRSCGHDCGCGKKRGA